MSLNNNNNTSVKRVAFNFLMPSHLIFYDLGKYTYWTIFVLFFQLIFLFQNQYEQKKAIYVLTSHTAKVCETICQKCAMHLQTIVVQRLERLLGDILRCTWLSVMSDLLCSGNQLLLICRTFFSFSNILYTVICYLHTTSDLCQ